MTSPEQPRERAGLLRRERRWLCGSLRRRGVFCEETRANFLLVRLGDSSEAARFRAFCAARNVLVRDRSSCPGLEGAVRITVGERRQNSALLDCLDGFHGAGNPPLEREEER